MPDHPPVEDVMSSNVNDKAALEAELAALEAEWASRLAECNIKEARWVASSDVRKTTPLRETLRERVAAIHRIRVDFLYAPDAEIDPRLPGHGHSPRDIVAWLEAEIANPRIRDEEVLRPAQDALTAITLQNRAGRAALRELLDLLDAWEAEVTLPYLEAQHAFKEALELMYATTGARFREVKRDLQALQEAAP